MAKKQVAAVVKIQIPAGQPHLPPVGTALGPHGVAIMDFCKDYNAKTEDKRGQIVPVEITIYEDRSFSFILKTPHPVPDPPGRRPRDRRNNPGREVAGTITKAQVEEIANTKMPDLNAIDLEGAMLQVEAPPARWASRSSERADLGQHHNRNHIGSRSLRHTSPGGVNRDGQPWRETSSTRQRAEVRS